MHVLFRTGFLTYNEVFSLFADRQHGTWFQIMNFIHDLTIKMTTAAMQMNRAKKRRFVFGYILCMIIFFVGYLINNYISKYVIVKELICIIFIDFKRTKKRSHTKQTHGEMEKKTQTKRKQKQIYHEHKSDTHTLIHCFIQFFFASLSSSDFIWDAQKIRKEKSNDSMKMTILMYE